ncbi:MAG: hypothetical protein ACO34J_01965, partial [Prochlorothrix sp.]
MANPEVQSANELWKQLLEGEISLSALSSSQIGALANFHGITNVVGKKRYLQLVVLLVASQSKLKAYEQKGQLIIIQVKGLSIEEVSFGRLIHQTQHSGSGLNLCLYEYCLGVTVPNSDRILPIAEFNGSQFKLCTHDPDIQKLIDYAYEKW